MKTSYRQRQGARRGVALVIVLGMLALMTLLAVAFSIYMRTERMASGNFKSDVRTRQLLHAALTRAIADINAYMAERNLVYPEWDVFSTGASNNPPVQILDATSVLPYIPLNLQDAAKNCPVYWALEEVAGGWYAYLAFNCSGFLDANYAGGSAVHTTGMNVAEFQLDQLYEMANTTTFYDDRGRHVKFETLEEFSRLMKPPAGTGLATNAINFTVYSRFLPGTNSGGASWGVDLNQITNCSAEIIQAFARAMPDADPVQLASNLIDYVDGNSVPCNLASPCTESVPMLNEVKVQTILLFDEPTAMCTPYVIVKPELFYPFVRGSGYRFDLDYDIKVEATTGTPPAFAFAPSQHAGLNDSGYTPGEPFRCWEVQNVHFDGAALAFSNYIGNTIQYAISMHFRVKINGSTPDPVDEVPSPQSNSWFTIMTTPLVIPNVVPAPNPDYENALVLASVDGAECIDPRFNWDPDPAANYWIPYAAMAGMGGDEGSIGVTNIISQFIVSGGAGIPSDSSMAMFVADAPLQTVGELSYLVRNKSANSVENWWNTVRLIDQENVPGQGQPLDPILDYFTIGTNAPVRRGLVNPNTRQAGVLTAVFNGVPLDDYPGQGAPIVSASQARELAVAFSNSFWHGRFANLSDIGHATNIFFDTFLHDLPLFQKEAVIRNTAGLLGTRQNLFTIILVAETTKREILPNGQPYVSIRSSQKAIAEVWRDPFLVNGRYATYIRYFKILPE